MNTWAVIFFSCFLILTGCTTTVPVDPAKKVVYIKVTNESDHPNIDQRIQERLTRDLESDGWVIANQPQHAFEVLEISVRDISSVHAKSVDQPGLTDALSNDATTGFASGLSSGILTGGLAGAAVGGVIGLVSGLIGQNSEAYTYWLVADARVSQRVAHAATFNRVQPHWETSTSNAREWLVYDTEIRSARQHDTPTFAEVEPHLIDRISDTALNFMEKTRVAAWRSTQTNVA